MGTHATTRIQKDGDYVELETRWDGFPEQIKSNVKTGIQDFTTLVEYIECKIKEKKLVLPEMSQWVESMKYFLKQAQKNPSIASVAALLTNRYLNHHHILPVMTSASSDNLEYWGYDSPDVLIKIKDSILEYKKQGLAKAKNLKEKPISDSSFLVRLVDDENTTVNSQNYDQFSFTDVKVVGMSKEEFKNLVSSMPLFWLEFHTLLRTSDFITDDKVDKETKEKHNDSIREFYNNNPIARNFSGYKFNTFYQPSQEYDRYAREKTLLSILDDVSAMIPFDFSSGALATHLSLVSAGKVQPLTRAELLWSVKQDDILQISIIPSKNRTSILEVGDTTTQYLHTILEKNNERFDNIKKQLNPSFEQIVSLDYYMSENKTVSFDYENNMVVCFDLLSQTDNPHKIEEAKELKKKIEEKMMLKN